MAQLGCMGHHCSPLSGNLPWQHLKLILCIHPITLSFHHLVADSTCLLQSIANHFGTVASVVPNFLNIVDFAHRVVGPKPLQFLSDMSMKLPGHIMPRWNPYMPRVCPSTSPLLCCSAWLLRQSLQFTLTPAPHLQAQLALYGTAQQLHTAGC